MAKKKKHRVKKSKHNNKDVKKSTINTNPVVEKGDLANSSESNQKSNENYVIKDVKFSMILLSIIIFCFVVIYILMMNKSVSNYFYGLIKISF